MPSCIANDASNFSCIQPIESNIGDVKTKLLGNIICSFRQINYNTGRSVIHTKPSRHHHLQVLTHDLTHDSWLWRKIFITLMMMSRVIFGMGAKINGEHSIIKANKLPYQNPSDSNGVNCEGALLQITIFIEYYFKLSRATGILEEWNI